MWRLFLCSTVVVPTDMRGRRSLDPPALPSVLCLPHPCQYGAARIVRRLHIFDRVRGDARRRHCLVACVHRPWCSPCVCVACAHAPTHHHADLSRIDRPHARAWVAVAVALLQVGSQPHGVAHRRLCALREFTRRPVSPALIAHTLVVWSSNESWIRRPRPVCALRCGGAGARCGCASDGACAERGERER